MATKSDETIFSVNKLDPDRIPQHVAIIMDGNGRWAKKRLMPRNFGHKAGTEAMRKTIRACVDLNIKYLSVYVFSTENWKRPEQEVSFLMNLIKELFMREIAEIKQEGARIRCLGVREGLSPDVIEQIEHAESETAENDRVIINLMLNYGSRREITEASKQMIKDVQSGKLTDITEDTISQYLFTKDVPDPEILIRTGGDIRVSNFLLWQIAYSELFFIDSLWPDFNKETLIQILQQYQKRDRRFGGLNQ